MVIINRDAVGAGVFALLAALEPADIPSIDKALADLADFRNHLAGRFAAPGQAAPAQPNWTAKLVRMHDALAARLTDQGELLERVADEVAKLSATVAEELGKAASVAHLCRNEVPDTDAALASANERCDKLKVERAELATDLERQKKLVVTTLADRVAVQSELLSKRAEAPAADDLPGPVPRCMLCTAGLLLPESVAQRACRRCREANEKHNPAADPVPVCPAVTVIDDPEADLPVPPPVDPLTLEMAGRFLKATEPELFAAPSTNGSHPPNSDRTAEGTRQRRLRIAAVLAGQPLTAKEVAERTGLKYPTAYGLLSASGGWFERSGKGRYTLADEGRKALAEEGFFMVPEPATKPAEAEPSDPEPATEAPEATAPEPERVDPTDKAAVAKAQCRVIAEAMREAREPLSSHEIGRKAGLPTEAVVERLVAHGNPRDQGTRLFLQLPTGLWKLTNAGSDFAEAKA